MTYYDIHTHKQEIRHDEMAIISVDIRKPYELNHLCNHFFSAGVHPWYIEAYDQEAAKLLLDAVCRFAHLPAILAIGETGLDKSAATSASGFALQQEIFISHARLSEEVKKPLIIHCVKAWEELLHIRQSIKPAMPWIIHGFRGKATLASRLLNSGLYLSFGIHYNIDSLKAAWQKGRLLLETDDKNIAIRTVYQQVACDLTISEDVLSKKISCNFHAIHKL